jgi:hypothetical protein
MKKIWIYDDEERIVAELRKKLAELLFLQKEFAIEAMKEDEFENTMSVLTDRQRSFRDSGSLGDNQIPLDATSILVVDFDLAMSKVGAYLTSEHIAYLARCFSTCGLIIGLNLPKYRDNGFDLTLRGYPESFADLNIGGRQLSNPGLWGGEATGFRPWHWPVLPKYMDDFEKKVIDIRNSLASDPKDDLPICQVLGFPPDVFDLLPRSIVQFLGREPTKATFRDFVLESRNGLQPKDVEAGSKIKLDLIARIGAARISKWLERLVLPGQDIIVDAPHLVSRFPSLLEGDAKNIETWNQTATLASYKEIGLRTNIIEPFRLQKEYWLSRPVWFWDKLREYGKIVEVREPWKTKQSGWIFCEDASRFHKGECREFVADIESPYERRYVRVFKGADYRPLARFSS